MSPADHAARKRELRARRRKAAALAGGWGRRAQIAAWDETLPNWREALVMVCDHRPDVADFHALSRRLNAEGRFLARPWYRLLMQHMHRRMDATPQGRAFGRFNGYPVETS